MSNPIESVLATVRHRTIRTKYALLQDTAWLVMFKLVMVATLEFLFYADLQTSCIVRIRRNTTHRHA